MKGCYYTASYDGTDGLYLSVLEENKDKFLFGTVYYYEPVYIQDENRIFIKYGKHHGRDFNFINGRWK